jgi:hypothetical protein
MFHFYQEEACCVARPSPKQMTDHLEEPIPAGDNF